jgi:excinuclease ABC subunit B
MTIPQLQAMPAGDKARKTNLVKYGFRLPSALDHRPLNFSELEARLGRTGYSAKESTREDEFRSKTYQRLQKQIGSYDTNALPAKKDTKTIFLSATPAEYELSTSQQIIQQIIRPTGLLDPITHVYPKSGDYEMLESSIIELVKKKPHLQEFLDGYSIRGSVEEVFGDSEINGESKN